MQQNLLRLGAAYHGNRMPHHAREDLLDMATHGMDLVVHMFSHTDWDRHKMVMKDMIAMSEDIGLEVWVDNWGLDVYKRQGRIHLIEQQIFCITDSSLL